MVQKNLRDFEALTQTLASGGVIAIPTDTVFGLACDMESEVAVRAIYGMKGRPTQKALPIFIKSVDDLSLYAATLTDEARRLSKKYWPGPLTLIVTKSSRIPDSVTAGQPTVAVRIPNHRGVLDFLKSYGRPLAVTSANRSGSPELRTAGQVRAVFGDQIKILDGECPLTAAVSTIVDVSGESAHILRQGRLVIEKFQILQNDQKFPEISPPI